MAKRVRGAFCIAVPSFFRWIDEGRSRAEEGTDPRDNQPMLEINQNNGTFAMRERVSVLYGKTLVVRVSNMLSGDGLRGETNEQRRMRKRTIARRDPVPDQALLANFRV